MGGWGRASGPLQSSVTPFRRGGRGDAGGTAWLWAQPCPRWLGDPLPPRDLQWAELICMTKLARVSKCCRKTSVTLPRTSSREEGYPLTMREQAALPPAASAHLSSSGVMGGGFSGAGEERDHRCGGGPLPEDLESGVEGGCLLFQWLSKISAEEISFAISKCLHPLNGCKVISSLSGLDNRGAFRITL